APPAAVSRETASVAVSPLRILLAEDNEVNQTVALRLLERLGHRADTASNGREALAKLEGAAYDVVLMDVQMPEMDGPEAGRRVCARWPAGERPRIVAMTAEAMQGDREKCLAAGMEDYIVKPVTLGQLGDALARCQPWPRASGPGAGPAGDGIAGEPALDRAALDQLREDLGGDASVQEVIATFLARTPTVLSSLRAAAAKGDADGMRQAAHALKGTSATLGARELAGQCEDLERLARAGAVPDAPRR